MKAILIDPFGKEVIEVEYNGDFRHIQELIECEVFDCTTWNEHTFFVDDYGLFEYKSGFLLNGYCNPLMGKALVLNTDEEGNSIDCELTIKDIIDNLTFIDVDDYLLK